MEVHERKRKKKNDPAKDIGGSFSAAIRQVQYKNPGASLNLNGINPYHEFYSGKLFVMVDDKHREPKAIPYELVELLKP
ncbi:hypothetical protein RJT34_20646 [Clitoria ternatea]|uniref:Uncharacterized protein n=1 Tax=Clitoria ternatea TaxID=43366 RepID=A0AAN9IT80_CLITE